MKWYQNMNYEKEGLQWVRFYSSRLSSTFRLETKMPSHKAFLLQEKVCEEDEVESLLSILFHSVPVGIYRNVPELVLGETEWSPKSFQS